MIMPSGCWTELNTDRLRRNCRLLRRALHPRTALYFVVKADAYGHGLAPVTGSAAAAGIDRFAVAHVHEGIALRRLLPDGEILVLCAPPPETAPDLVRYRLTPLIAGPEHAMALAKALRKLPVDGPLACHLKIDTGMSRLGFDWPRAVSVLQRLAAVGDLGLPMGPAGAASGGSPSGLPPLRAVGLASHFAAAGGDAPHQAARQFNRFQRVTDECRRHGIVFPLRHISASGGVCENPAWDLDAVRMGIILYGYPPGPSVRRLPVEPVLEWKTRILQVKALPSGRTVGYGHTHTMRLPGRIAVLSVGYADGYSRAFSRRGVVLIDGCRCPVIGRVSMNLTAVSLPPGCRAKAGDIAVLIGRQGRDALGADELAALSGTIPYEILTSIRAPQGP